MSLVRFDRAAIATGAVIVGLFTLVEMRTGVWTAPVGRDWTLDRIIFQVLLVALVYAGLFVGGHRLARRHGSGDRLIYALIGSVAALPASLIGLGGEAMSEAVRSGVLSVFLVAPLGVGAATGFLYHRRAGYETAGDDPDALAKITASSEPIPPAQFGRKAGLVQTDTADYYDGPLQIKTSGMAALIAALIGGVLHSLITFSSLVSDPLPIGAMPPVLRTNPALGLVQAIVGISMLYLVFVKAAHGYLQRREKSSLVAYAMAGVVVPLVLGLALAAVGLGFAGLLMTAQFMAPAVAAMLAYHVLAGMEPLALPDDIEVSDPRTLVGADHVRRQVRRVIHNKR